MSSIMSLKSGMSRLTVHKNTLASAHRTDERSSLQSRRPSTVTTALSPTFSRFSDDASSTGSYGRGGWVKTKAVPEDAEARVNRQLLREKKRKQELEFAEEQAASSGDDDSDFEL